MKGRVKRYLKYFKVLATEKFAAPAQLWSDYHPKIVKKLNPKLEKALVSQVLPYFKDSCGIVIGGSLPSQFNQFLGYSRKVVNVDVVDNYPGSSLRVDYLTDAANLHFAGDGDFDFVCSCHVLEHLANPLKAIYEWMRVIKQEGIIYCATPDKRFTFDHLRKRTTLDHIVSDFQNNVGHNDLTHLNDVLLNYDYALAQVTKQDVLRMVTDYYSSVKNGGTALYQPHHHVFVKDDLVALFKYAKLEVFFAYLEGMTAHVVARKA